MAFGKTYSIHNNRIRRGVMEGFLLTEEGTLKAKEEEISHLLFLDALDGVEKDSRWGRFQIQAVLPEDAVLSIYVCASNEKTWYTEQGSCDPEGFFHDRDKNFWDKKEFLRDFGWKRFIGKQDVLLYELEGRYLWLCIEIHGLGEAQISHMKVTTQNEDFMGLFPEVYREWGSFFHRYLSIYTALYYDSQEHYDRVAELFDFDKTPKELLPVLAGWLGLDLSGNILEESVTRALVKEAYALNKRKGTRWAIEKITEIILGETPTIVENNVLKEQERSGVLAERRSKQYGRGRYDVTVMIHREVEEKKKVQFSFILRQFLPIRCSLHILYLKDRGVLDEHTYLDLNAKVYESNTSALDRQTGLDSYVILQ